VKILVVPMELPLPATSGGRIDVWRRLRLLHDDGHELALLSWHNLARDGAVAPGALAELGTVCATHHLSWIRRSAGESLRRGLQLAWMPSHAAARWVTLDRPAVLGWARAFAPDLLLLDGLWGVAAVRWLAAALGRPWVYRAHNVEHVYMRQQRDRAVGWRARGGLSANLLGLRRLEEATVRDAAAVYDISPADAAQWRAQGRGHVQWLPTVVDAGFERAMAAAAALPPAWDIAYFGNLNTPNNVEAVEWLLRRVLPLLPSPGLRVAVAGSRPSDAVRRLVAADARVTLLADPPSVPAVAGAARVLVNTVQAGSGVNLKSVEMLFGSAALVSTPAGVQGLPDDAAACFAVHADAAGFAQAVAAALQAGPAPADARRIAARAPYAPAAAAALLRRTLQPVIGRGAA
jgi:hypothetical protein